MQKISILAVASLSLFVSGVAANAAVSNRANTVAATGSGASFVTAPFQVGSQTLYSAAIVNVNSANLGIVGQRTTLSGNNAGSAPQGGVGSRQGGLGFSRVAEGAHASNGFTAASIAGGTTANNTLGASASGNSLTNSLGSTTSTGFQSSQGVTTNTGSNNGLAIGSAGSTSVSQNLNGGLSSTGSTAGNISTGMSSVGQSSANNNSGSSSVGQNSANNAGGLSSTGQTAGNTAGGSSSVGQNSANNGTTGGTTPVLVLTNLTASASPLYGSTGASFQGAENSQITSVSFQYGTLSSANGQITSSTQLAPFLAIDDQTTSNSGQKTRYIPVTNGTVSAPTNGIGLTTVSFNANQLRITGKVSHIGIAFLAQGTVLVNNIAVNNTPSSGLLAQGNQTFPF